MCVALSEVSTLKSSRVSFGGSPKVTFLGVLCFLTSSFPFPELKSENPPIVASHGVLQFYLAKENIPSNITLAKNVTQLLHNPLIVPFQAEENAIR